MIFAIDCVCVCVCVCAQYIEENSEVSLEADEIATALQAEYRYIYTQTSLGCI